MSLPQPLPRPLAPSSTSSIFLASSCQVSLFPLPSSRVWYRKTTTDRYPSGRDPESARAALCSKRKLIRLGVSVRDFNFYPHFQDALTRQKVCETIRSFYQDEIWGDYEGGPDCTFLPHTYTCFFNPSLHLFVPSSSPLRFLSSRPSRKDR